MTHRRASTGIPLVANGYGMAGSENVVYTVDRCDAIIDVNDAWSAFAKANAGDSLLPPAILGRVLWDFISEPTTNLVYRQLFERVRDGAGPVRFEFRCDSPDTRRLLRMTITPEAAHAIRVVVRPVQTMKRASVALLDPATPRTEAIVTMCAWCKRIPDPDGKWLEVEAALSRIGLFTGSAVPAISHGMCSDCACSMERALADPAVAATGSISLGAFLPGDDIARRT